MVRPWQGRGLRSRGAAVLGCSRRPSVGAVMAARARLFFTVTACTFGWLRAAFGQVSSIRASSHLCPRLLPLESHTCGPCAPL